MAHSRVGSTLMAKGRLNKSQRLKRLLEKGFFPKELPPPFVSDDFARFRQSLHANWPAANLKAFKSAPELFSVPRHGRARRRLSIINPINHYKVSKIIADEWIAIKNFLSSSAISEFKPVFDVEGTNAFFGIDFDKVEKNRNRILSNYDTCVKTDISRYYHTIYTHSIPWALYGKSYCKSNMNTPAFKATLGDKLDTAIRQCQSNQTIGIPVGPETSRVIGEIIGVGIEQSLHSEIPQLADRSFRFVDDIFIGIDIDENPSTILAHLSRSLSHFELDMNIEKTKIIGVNEEHESDWISELRRYNVGRLTKNQQHIIEEYFKKSLFFYSKNPREGVLRYAIKKSRSFSIKREHKSYYFDWITRLSRQDTSCLPNVCQILIESNHNNNDVDRPKIRLYIISMIQYHKSMQYSFELSWLLFLAKGLRISLTSVLINDLTKIESSILGLLILDLNQMGLVDGPLDMLRFVAQNTPDGLVDSGWLLIYEGTLKGWLPKATPCHVSSHPLFGPMLNKNISFYDVKKNVTKTAIEMKQRAKTNSVAKFIFNNIDDYF